MISNATKFTDKGHVKIFVEFVAGDEIEASQIRPKYAFQSAFSSINPVRSGIEGLHGASSFSRGENSLFEMLTSTSKKFDTGWPYSLRQHNIRSHQQEKSGYIRLEIVDSGCGMTPEQINSLFRKFAQVNSESQKRQIGTGLGLWITKELIELMNGMIEVYSTPNVGTCFVILIKSHSRLPVNEIQMNPRELPGNQLISQYDLNCMIVEDIVYNQEINRKFLSKCGLHNIFIASNGQEAVDLFKSKPRGFFSFLLMDLDMPVLDGKSACRLIRSFEKEMNWEPCKIIILTAFSEAKTKDALLDPNGAFKADCFLSKPASYETVLKTLQALRIIGLKRAEDSKMLSSARKKKVLVVEDDMFNLDLLQKMLIALGVERLSASNGAEAIKVYKQHSNDIQLILMDCEMPIPNGFEAAREISKLAQDNHIFGRLSIIGLSGHSGSLYEAKAKESGMKMLLTKPISIDQLRTLLKTENIIDYLKYHKKQ